MKHVHIFIFLFLTCLSVSAQESTIKVILNSERSTIQDTLFRVKSVDNSTADIPVTLICGAHEGPTFTIIAGIHGMEYPTIVSLLEFRKEIDPSTLKGNLIIIPIVNVTSFYSRTPFVNPVDNLNLNRVFPGNPSGTITEAMAHFLVEQIYPITDVLLDMHGGDVSEDLMPFICHYNNQEFKQQTEQASRLSEISGFNTIVSYPYALPADQPAMYAFKQAVRQGITALSIEIGKLGNWENTEVSFTKDAIYRMMAELNMYDNKKVKSIHSETIRYNGQAYISVPVQGIFHSTVKAGDFVLKNAVLGNITDLFGNKLTTIVAPESGIVLYKVGTPPVNQGETLFCIGFEKKDRS